MSLLNMFVLRGLLQIFLLIVTGIHTCTNGFSIGTSVDKAKTCSNFDFQEKLLEKMVRLEHSVELERKLKKFEDMLSEKVIEMENTNNEKMKEMENHMNAKLELLDEEDVKRRDSFQSQRIELIEEQNRQKDEFTKEMARQKDEFAKEKSRHKDEFAKEMSRQKDEFAKQISRQKDDFANELSYQKDKFNSQNKASVEAIRNINVRSEAIENKIMDKQNNLLQAFNRSISNKNRHFDESVAEMNATFTLFMATTNKESENQQNVLLNMMNGVKLNTSLLNQRILDQQRKNDDKLLSFLETESSQNKVSLTVSPQYYTYSAGEAILFPFIHTRNGVSSQVISDLNTTGIFTCEKPGLYLISIYLLTGKHNLRVYLYKNDSIIALQYYSLSSEYETNSATVLETLSINDTLTVKTSDAVQIYSDRSTCLSILQITYK